MKTQIIQLEPHDDHISIRDKMNWSKTPRVLLIWPRRRRVDLSTLDLKLLQRHAINLGAELGLVTKTNRVIRAASELGIPVFANNLAAQREAWQPQRRSQDKRPSQRKNLRQKGAEFNRSEAKWRKHPVVRLGFSTFAALAVLTLAIAFFPKAEITIEPERRLQTVTIPVRANAQVQDVFLSGSVPAQTLTVYLTNQRSLAASGQMAVPAKVARGTVIFRNLTDLPVNIPAGTIIRSVTNEEIRFTTLEDGEIAGGVDENIAISVKALVFGERGNLEPDMLQAIEGELGLWLAATNPEATTGGGDSFVSAPTTRDREELRDLVMAYFYAHVDEEIQKEMDAKDLVFPESLTEAEVLAEDYEPSEGEPGDRLELTMRVSFQVEFARETDLAQLAQSSLSASLPQGYSPIPESLQFNPVSAFEYNPLGATSWQMCVEQELSANISAIKVAGWVQGRTPDIARQRLEENLELASVPKISITPSWWSWLPIAPFRIDVILK